MKKLLFFICLLIAGFSFGQGNWTLSGAKNRWGNGFGNNSKSAAQLAAFNNASDSILMQVNRVTQRPTFRYSVSDPWTDLALWGDTAKYIPYTTIEAYGYVSGDATSYLQMAVNSGKSVFLGNKRYLITSTITVPFNGSVFGTGDSSALYTNSNIPVITVGAPGVKIKDFKIIGNGNVANYAIYINGIGNGYSEKPAIRISGMTFQSVGYGIYSTLTPGRVMTLVSDCRAFKASFAGFANQSSSEYFSYVNCTADSSNIVWYNIGGNNYWTGGGGTNSTYGAYFAAGSNDLHSNMVNAVFAHCSIPVYIDNPTYNFDFIGCRFGLGKIFLRGGSGVKFSECTFISIDSINMDGVVNGRFYNNTATGTIPVIDTAYNTNVSYVQWFNNPDLPAPYNRSNLTGALTVSGQASVNTLSVTGQADIGTLSTSGQVFIRPTSVSPAALIVRTETGAAVSGSSLNGIALNGVSTNLNGAQISSANNNGAMIGSNNAARFAAGFGLSSTAPITVTTAIIAGGGLTTIGDISTTANISGVLGTFSGLLTGSSNASTIVADGNANIQATDQTAIAVGTGGSVALGGKYTTGGAIINNAVIFKAYKETSTSGQYGFGLSIGTRTDGSGNPTEKVYISPTGNMNVVGDFTAANVTSGTYTPTQTGASTNVNSINFYPAQYSRVGSTVTVSGLAEVSPTTPGVNTNFYITIPVASAFTQAYQAGGAGVGYNGVSLLMSFVAHTSGIIFVQCQPSAATSTYTYSFTYKVL